MAARIVPMIHVPDVKTKLGAAELYITVGEAETRGFIGLRITLGTPIRAS